MLLRPLSRVLLWSLRWRAVEAHPLPDRCILIGAPHTSNLDGFYCLLVAFTLNFRIRWVVKAELDRPVIGGLLRSLGAIFIARGSGSAMETIERHIQGSERFCLAIAPEGTRAKGARWRTGFLHIAEAHSLPIVLGYLDFSRREGGTGPIITDVSDRAALQDALQTFYGDITARHPDQVSPILLG
ncbi:MAG: 1-acyl-sn-glycerol-3-phosphate acyltransferase [Myxococcota bacterium]|jgi:1-acyl-sn-glycerol-3-phosphate acyltransferase